MKKQKPFKNLARLLKKGKSVFPFTQQPPVENKPDPNNPKQMEASDLFSHFTANVIKEKVVFTR